eukprot:Skav226000  [mRNA]  locus=scaffold735:77510:90405:+ [translate_table: standard]
MGEGAMCMALSCASPRSRVSDVSHKSQADVESEEADLICVLLVARHSERTPKQKVKASVNLQSDYGAGMLLGWLQGGVVGADSVLVTPRTLELRAKDQLLRLADAARRREGESALMIFLARWVP